MKNKPDTSPTLKLTNVIYNFNCSFEDCRLQPNVNYIGYTTTTLSRRLTMHIYIYSIWSDQVSLRHGFHSRQLADKERFDRKHNYYATRPRHQQASNS